MFYKIQILFFSLLLKFFLFLVFASCKWKIHNLSSFSRAKKKSSPILLCCWHSRFLLVAKFLNKRNIPVWAGSSTHRDSQIMAKILHSWKFKLIRGSSRRGWRNVLKTMMSLLRKNAIIAVTNDGPKGPARVAKKGAVMLAYKQGSQILSVSGSVSNYWCLNSWDKTIIPKPFSTIHIQFGSVFTGFKKNNKEVEEISQYINKNFLSLNKLIK